MCVRPLTPYEPGGQCLSWGKLPGWTITLCHLPANSGHCSDVLWGSPGTDGVALVQTGELVTVAGCGPDRVAAPVLAAFLCVCPSASGFLFLCRFDMWGFGLCIQFLGLLDPSTINQVD